MRRRDVLSATLLLGLLAAGGSPAGARAEAPVRVAAAASLRQALDEVIALHERRQGQRLVATYGATGNLARQIIQGAPFDLLVAADETSAARLAAQDLTAAPPSVLLVGRLSLVVARASPLDFRIGERQADGGMPRIAGLREALEGGRILRLAIANPEIAPYGQAAREALGTLDLLGLASARLVYGENIGQVAQYVATGAAEAGITALSLTMAEPFAGALRGVPLPAALHAPIRHSFAVMRRAGPAAHRFAAFLTSDEARAIFDRHGFERP